MDALTTMDLLEELTKITKKYKVVLDNGIIRPLFSYESKGGCGYGVFANNAFGWVYPGSSEYPRKQVPLRFKNKEEEDE